MKKFSEILNFDKQETISPKINQGKNINLKTQIFQNWSYAVKKALVSSIGENLSQYGYEVSITYIPDSKVGMFRIYVKSGRSDFLVFSTNYRDKCKTAIISNTPRDCSDKIIEKILLLIEGEK